MSPSRNDRNNLPLSFASCSIWKEKNWRRSRKRITRNEQRRRGDRDTEDPEATWLLGVSTHAASVPSRISIIYVVNLEEVIKRKEKYRKELRLCISIKFYLHFIISNILFCKCSSSIYYSAGFILQKILKKIAIYLFKNWNHKIIKKKLSTSTAALLLENFRIL
jgi:hypothetical protein